MRDHGIIGESPAVVELRRAIEDVAASTLPVLIHGPTGSGKELVAQALHDCSGRRGRMVPFNVCAIGESMFEDALFGHVRGAFTGAVHDSPGFFREADGGTLFLDEIGALPMSQQVKLLRALETGEFRPVGARQNARSVFRVVTATNERIDRLIDSGRFRADLMHRIAAFQLEVPPLRSRSEDIPLLVAHFLATVAPSGATATDAALRLLTEFPWPGNVRELKNVVQTCAAIGGVTAERVERVLAARRTPERGTEVVAEHHLMVAALRRHRGDTVAVASELGVDRSTVYRRLRTLGISARPREDRI